MYIEHHRNRIWSVNKNGRTMRALRMEILLMLFAKKTEQIDMMPTIGCNHKAQSLTFYPKRYNI